MRIFIVFSMLCFFSGFSGHAQQRERRPNIILILADDLGYADIGCYGQQKINTPHIDALARGGIRFTQFYSGSTVCAPARASLMTGLHTGHLPVRGNKEMQPEGQFPLPEDAASFPSELRKAGYATAAFGKWGLGFINSSGAPGKQGFDKFYGYNCQRLAHNYYPDHLWDNEKRVDLPGNGLQPSLYAPDLIQAEALKFLQQQGAERPFFLYLAYTLPHADLTPPHDSLYDHYIKLFDEKPPKENSIQNANKQVNERYPHAAFAAMVARLDRYVGEVVAAVNSAGLMDNTLVIFTSDNGPHRERGGDPEFFNSNGMYRGIKRDLYEGGIRVPLIIRWQGKIRAGRVTDQLAALWDFFPTFQQLAGLPVSKGTDGISFLPLLQQRKQQAHTRLYWEFHEGGGRQALRWKNWKLVQLNVSTARPGLTELYDLKKDPGETYNRAGQHPGIVTRMKKWMKAAHRSNRDWPLYPEEKLAK